MITIDAKDLLVGRFATHVAKQALLGEKINIVNCEKAVISGSKEEVVAKFKNSRDRGATKGPFLHRTPAKFVKRIIRGMIPYKKGRGKEAFEKITCYNKVPEDLLNEKFITYEEANIEKLPNLRYVDVGHICKQLGGKI
jgi:large subunit ribosomal protein L13